jgi:hypothetical protein
MAGIIPRIEFLGEKGSVLVGAGDDTVATTDALAGGDLDDTVGSLVRSAGRTDVNAGGFLALIATHRKGGNIDDTGILGLVGDKLYPCHPKRQKVLYSAGGYAGMASTALGEVNNHSISHDLALLY